MNPQLQEIIDKFNKLDFSDRFRFYKTLEMADGVNIQLGLANGTKIGLTAAQLLGFWGLPPVAQYVASANTSGFSAGGGAGANNGSTWTGGQGATAYTVGDLIRALKLCGIIQQ